VFTSLGWNVDLHLDVHSDGTGPGQTVYSGGFMPDGMSRVALSNSRGTMLLGLTSPNDSCTKAGLSFDGTTVSGTGTWSVTSANGSYRQASGSGNYNIVQAHVAPGAINSFHLTLTGSITVLSPAMQISLVSTSWGNLGLDYVSRIVTATYQIKNVGTGDSFAPTLTSATSHADGVTSLGPVPQALDDLAAGASTQVSVKYQLALLQPCQLVILNCSFGTTVGVNMPDALDVPFPQTSANVQVIAPTLPPPL
jgi:hypothetical protein